MRYKGKIEQITIFGQLEFIEDEDYIHTSNDMVGYTNVSGKYKILGSDDTIELTLAFLKHDLKKYLIN